MVGRKPVPTAVKKRNGNPGKRAHNKEEPVVENAPDSIPGRLTKAERAVWRRYAAPVREAGLLTRADVGPFSRYCGLTVLYEILNGQDWETAFPDMTNPARLRSLAHLSAQLRALESDLGMNSASRSRIIAPVRTPEPAPAGDGLPSWGELKRVK